MASTRTESGHHSHLVTRSWSIYHPTPFPALEQRLFPPRHRQTLQHTATSSFISIVRLGYVLSVLLPLHVVASLISHLVYPRSRWIERGYGRGVFPTRLPNWGLGQTIGVPMVGSLFWALVYGTPKGMGWEEEKTIPAASKWLFGRGHEGWCIEAEGVILPPLPTNTSARATSEKEALHLNGNGVVPAREGGDVRRDDLRKRGVSKEGGAKPTLVERAAKATTLGSTLTAPEASPYDPSKENIPLDILRGSVVGTQFGVTPVPIAAFWQWKSVASAVSRGQVISVKPGNDIAGIGSGPAVSPSERMVLFFVGGGYHSGHAPQGPLSWTVCRQTSLRVLGLNFRKATKDEFAFPASLQDALAAWVYVTKRLGFKAENVILMGDSAGGGLALSLQLYLSALEWSAATEKGRGRLGRAKKLVLHSPMTDLTLDTRAFTCNQGVDIISPYMCSLARDNYLRHVIPVSGRKNPHLEKPSGQTNIDTVAARYAFDPYTAVTSEMEESEEFQTELALLAKELPETIVDLGAFHPLFSMGLDARSNKYLAQALLLFKPTPAMRKHKEGRNGGEMEVLVTAGTAEIFYDQIKLFTRNLLDLNRRPESDGASESDAEAEKPKLGDESSAKTDSIKVSLVECLDWHHVFAYMNCPGEVKAQVDDVAKTFMLS